MNNDTPITTLEELFHRYYFTNLVIFSYASNWHDNPHKWRFIHEKKITYRVDFWIAGVDWHIEYSYFLEEYKTRQADFHKWFISSVDIEISKRLQEYNERHNQEYMYDELN